MQRLINGPGNQEIIGFRLREWKRAMNLHPNFETSSVSAQNNIINQVVADLTRSAHDFQRHLLAAQSIREDDGASDSYSDHSMANFNGDDSSDRTHARFLKNKVCYDYKNKGYCRRGDSCRFIHDDNNDSAQYSQHNQQSETDVREMSDDENSDN